MSRWAVALCIALATMLDGLAHQPKPSACTAFVHAALVNPVGPVTRDVTVVVCGGRIDAVGSASNVLVPSGSTIIDASRRYLMPGLWDMHVHLDQLDESAAPALVAHGITSVRDLGSAFDVVRQWREQTASGAMIAPRIKAAGVIFESPRFLQLVEYLAGKMPQDQADSLRESMGLRKAVSDVNEIEREVESAKQRGADVIKVRNVRRPDLL